jgi:hypothetical protein
MDNDIQRFNAFGSVVVKKARITVNLTAAKADSTIHRVLGKDVKLPDIRYNETCVAELGVLIGDKNSKTDAFMYEIVKPKSKKPLRDIPEVEQTISELVSILKRAIQS